MRCGPQSDCRWDIESTRDSQHFGSGPKLKTLHYERGIHQLGTSIAGLCRPHPTPDALAHVCEHLMGFGVKIQVKGSGHGCTHLAATYLEQVVS